jgi:hypothetical protein
MIQAAAASNSISDGQCIQTTPNASACITSTGGRFTCCLRRDGILALFDGPRRDAAYWVATPTPNTTLARPLQLCMQSNGTVAGRDANGTTFWVSSTHRASGHAAASSAGGPYTLFMQVGCLGLDKACHVCSFSASRVPL